MDCVGVCGEPLGHCQLQVYPGDGTPREKTIGDSQRVARVRTKGSAWKRVDDRNVSYRFFSLRAFHDQHLQKFGFVALTRFLFRIFERAPSGVDVRVLRRCWRVSTTFRALWWY